VKLDTKSRVAKRMQGIRGEAAFEMLARATELERQGRSIIHLEIGEPDFETPRPVISSPSIGFRRERRTIRLSRGIWELRTAIAAHLSSRHPQKIDPRRVLVTPGAKMMIYSIIQSMVDPGDEVICPDPSYPAYEAAIRMAGATPVSVKLDEAKEFRFDLNELARRITSRTKMIVINSPQNPTGGVLNLDDLRRIAELARKHDLLILSDEIYSEIYYADPPASILDIPNILDRVFFVNGFSKIYAMTGWRLGYGVVPEDAFQTIELFLNNSVSSTATFTQRAALEAFTPETEKITQGMVAEFRSRRDVFCRRAEQHSRDSLPETSWGFLSFPEYQRRRSSQRRICRPALERSGCRCTAGHGVRRIWGRLFAPVVRELSREPRGGVGTNPKVRGIDIDSYV
jgi:aspartate/methionine/tyrosine aminotransferase